MKYLEVEVPEKDAWILPIGDLHVGDKAFTLEGRRLLKTYIDWVKRNPNARVFLNGDIFNVASRISKTSPFDSSTSEYEEATEIFEPIKDQIIGATDGNHENRMLDMFGMSPTQHLCRELKINYCKWSACVRLKVGQRPENRWGQNYFLFFHHTSGSGSSPGAGLNKVVKLTELVQGVDVYFGSHNHQIATGAVSVFEPSMQKQEMVQKKIYFVDCGSYLTWNGSYAEQAMYRPNELGTPRVKFSGNQERKDIWLITGPVE